MSNSRSDVERYADVPLVFEAELDRISMTIRQLHSLEVGKTLSLSRTIGEDLPIYVGGALVGRGEAIRLDRNVGIRIAALSGPR